MEKATISKKSFMDVRRQRNLEILGICLRNCPLDIDKLISRIEFDTGLTGKKVRDVLKILYDIEKIIIEDNIVRVKKK